MKRRAHIRHLIAIEALVMFAGSLAGVFSIVYLVASGLSAFEASLFYLEAFILASILCLMANRSGFGHPRRWMSLAMLSLSLFYLCFVVLDGYFLLFVAPVFFGFYILGFWVPFNALMLRQTSRSNRGEIISFFFLVYPVIAVLSPIIGGFLISRISYDIIFACAFAALLSNAILILISPAARTKKMKCRISVKKLGKRLSMALFFEGGFEGVWFTAGPLLALLFVEDEFILGMLFALFGLAGGIASVIIGRISDRKGNRVKFIKAGALISAPLIFGIALSPDIATFAALTCAMSLTIPLIAILLFAQATDRMEKHLSGCALTREFLLNTGRVLGGVLCLLAILLTNDVRLAFAISGFMVVGAALVR